MNELTNALLSDLAVYGHYTAPAIRALRRGSHTPEECKQAFADVARWGLQRLDMAFTDADIAEVAGDLTGFYMEDITSRRKILPIPFVDSSGASVTGGETIALEDGRTGLVRFTEDRGALINVGGVPTFLADFRARFNGRANVLAGTVMA